MKKFNLIVVISFAYIWCVQAQVTFVIDSLPEYTPAEDTLFIAGDFQGWNPGDPAFVLTKNENDKWSITLGAMPTGSNIQFKFTRGDWGRVEKGPNGEEIPNRVFTYGNGDTVPCIIYNWADFGGGGIHTAAENVHVMDEAFYMPQLERTRRIWVYVPPDYEETTDHYPVIYMHDGQNLFDAYTSFIGEWEVDETLNELFEQGYQVPIVVGIDNGGTERINEYTPWVNPQHGGGQGGLYLQFLVETLKPHIDANYRTLTGRESTAIWGSSLGGLISHYGVLEYQNVFSKAGIYSPSYWWSETVWDFTVSAGIQEELMLYQMTGELEGGTMVPDTWAMHELLTNMGMGEQELSTTIIEGGEHNETLWKDDFADAYLWLFHSFANAVGELAVRPLVVFPNPAATHVSFPLYADRPVDLRLFTSHGKALDANSLREGNLLRISGIPPGIYILEAVTGKAIYRGKFVKQ